MNFPIHHTFGPHATIGFALRSWCLLFQPWKWRNGNDRERLRSALKQSFLGDVFLFSSGREALAALLRAMKLLNGEEVIVQAYTCVVVPNAIHAAGGVPVYADVDGDTLNLAVDDVERRITPHTRTVIAQHTFGIPADLKRLRTLCDERKIILIEDCAHTLPNDPASPIARTGEYAILSFGRDKAISGVSGGAVISRKTDISAALKESESHAGSLPFSMIARYLLYPLIYRKARALYVIGLGRIYLALCKKLRLLIPIVTPEEKQGNMILRLRKIPNACAALAQYSFKQLPTTNAHRRELTHLYMNECGKHGWNVLPGIQLVTSNQQPVTYPLQKFPLFFKNADAIRESLKADNIFLDDGWTGCVICPRGTNKEALGYATGSDPHAEALCEEILSLPTHPTMSLKQAQRLTTAIVEVTKMRNAECGMRNETKIPNSEFRIQNAPSITIQEATNPQEWDQFLSGQQYRPFLQSWTMGEVHRDCGQEPIRLVAKEGDQTVGICQAIFVPARRGKHLAVSYGPIVTHQHAAEEILKSLRTEAIARDCAFLRISSFTTPDSPLTIHHARPSPLHLLAEHIWYLPLQNPDPWNSAICNLQSNSEQIADCRLQKAVTEEDVFAAMRKTTRNLIRRAEKEGVTIEASKDPVHDLQYFLTLHDETRKRHGFTPYTNAFFRAQVVRFAPRNECTLYLARYQGNVIAASIHMHTYGETSYHHGASSYAHNKIPASYLLQWTAIRDALKRGDRVYNFWGIAPGTLTEEGFKISEPKHPFGGVTLFKTGFGGNLLNLMHCQDIPLTKKYYLTRGFEMMRKWKRGF